MKWSIAFEPAQPPFSIPRASNIYLAGSCFAAEWGRRLQDIQWPAIYHPLHITYQPQALLKQLEYIIGSKDGLDEHWVEVQGVWRHLDMHSKLSHSDQAVALDMMKQAKEKANQALQQAEYVIITLGTARSYTYLPTGKQVANCQKVPQSSFSVELESLEDITGQLFQIQSILKSLPRFRQAIWTVSPVRHLRSGLVENQRSKARLILAVEQLTQTETSAHYFPAYEWLIDVLRDYRFYDRDMTHPSAEAVDFILQKFTEMYFSPDAIRMLALLTKYSKLRQHRPAPTSAGGHEEKRQALKAKLQKEYPELDLD
jgi:hypothetical protein